MNESKQSTGNVFVDYLINEGLYGDGINITEDNIEDLIQLIGGKVNINMYCPKCRHKSVFRGNPVLYFRATSNAAGIPYSTGNSQKYDLANTISKNISYAEGFEIWNHDINDDTRIMTFKFDCAKDETHHLDYVVIIENNNIKKIGQYPSIADLENFDLKKCEKIINKQDKDELKRAIGLYSSGIGIGSFIYLRRVIERMIKVAGDKAIMDKKINENDFNKLHIVEKIKNLDGYLPEIIIKNAFVYGIVSKGVHALSEDECLLYFPALWKFTIMTLQQWEELRENELNKQEILTHINKINAELKKKK